MGTTDNRFSPLSDGWGLRGFWGGSVANNDNYTRIRSQHNGWDPEIQVNEGMMDRWVHVAHIYMDNMEMYVDGIKRYDAKKRLNNWKGPGKLYTPEVWYVPHRPMFVVPLRD